MKKIMLLFVLVCTGYTITKAQNNDLPAVKKEYAAQTNMALLQGKMFLTGNDAADNNGPSKDHDFYNNRSRTQRIVGLSLLGAGLVLGISGVLVASNNNSTDYDQRDRTIRTLFILSGATGIASIPFMIMAHASKNKARAALSGQKTFIPGKGNSYVTGVTVSIPIGK